MLWCNVCVSVGNYLRLRPRWICSMVRCINVESRPVQHIREDEKGNGPFSRWLWVTSLGYIGFSIICSFYSYDGWMASIGCWPINLHLIKLSVTPLSACNITCINKKLWWKSLENCLVLYFLLWWWMPAGNGASIGSLSGHLLPYGCWAQSPFGFYESVFCHTF